MTPRPETPDLNGAILCARSASLAGDEFIFDIQNHCVDPSGDWAKGESGRKCKYVLNVVKEVFLDSDTDVAVVSAPWGGRESNPTPMDYAAEARAIVAAADGGHRAMIHGGVMPNEEGALEFMEVQAKKYRAADRREISATLRLPGNCRLIDQPTLLIVIPSRFVAQRSDPALPEVHSDHL